MVDELTDTPDLEAVDATVGIVDDRVAMTADGDARLLVETPDRKPLSRTQRHATLRVVGDDYRASIELDADELALFADELPPTPTLPSSDEVVGVTATDEFVFNCRDCGFVGDWLTAAGCCPECGGRDLPTEWRGGE